jgi:ribosomal protein L29
LTARSEKLTLDRLKERLIATEAQLAEIKATFATMQVSSPSSVRR